MLEFQQEQLGSQSNLRPSALAPWVLEHMPKDWNPASYQEVPRGWSDLELLACYRYTRQQPSSLKGWLVSEAVLARYSDWVLSQARRYAPKRGVSIRKNADDYYAAGMEGFLVALDKYDPSPYLDRGNPAVPLEAYAHGYVKLYVLRQVLGELPNSPETDNTRKAYVQALETWERLAQEHGQEPTVDDVAEALAPQLPDRWGSIGNRRKIVRDVFRMLRNDTLHIGPEQDDHGSEYETFIQPPSRYMQPEDELVNRLTRQEERDIITYAYRRACERLHDTQEARKLLVVQVLLQVSVPRRQTHESTTGTTGTKGSGLACEYDLRKIAKILRNPTAKQQSEIEERWEGLWHNLDLHNFGLPRDWHELRLLFQANLTLTTLREWYKRVVVQADWLWDKA
ncbi:MAG TPA: hypothetical protein VF826_02520 [Chloroflexia bacterium]|jgi:hypothetical protein